jgi:hypothetical protein
VMSETCGKRRPTHRTACAHDFVPSCISGHVVADLRVSVVVRCSLDTTVTAALLHVHAGG